MKIYSTPEGYEYVRCRANGSDDTAYIQQLNVILDGADPEKVFDPDRHVHHRNGIPWDNRPENLEVQEASDHGRRHRLEQLGRGNAEVLAGP